MGISIWQLVIVLVIVLLLFGTKKLRNIGSDLGGAIKSFRSAVKEGEGETSSAEARKLEEGSADSVIDGEVTERKTDRV